MPVFTPSLEPDTRHAYHLYTLFIDNLKITRDQFLMNDRTISGWSSLYCPYLHPFTKKSLVISEGIFPTQNGFDRTVSLPLSPKLTDEDVEDVIEAVRRF